MTRKTLTRNHTDSKDDRPNSVDVGVRDTSRSFKDNQVKNTGEGSTETEDEVGD